MDCIDELNLTGVSWLFMGVGDPCKWKCVKAAGSCRCLGCCGLLNVNLNVIFSEAARESTTQGGGFWGQGGPVACFRQSWPDVSREFACCSEARAELMSWAGELFW